MGPKFILLQNQQYKKMEVEGPSGPWLLTGGRWGLLTLSFAPCGFSGRVNHSQKTQKRFRKSKSFQEIESQVVINTVRSFEICLTNIEIGERIQNCVTNAHRWIAYSKSWINWNTASFAENFCLLQLQKNACKPSICIWYMYVWWKYMTQGRKDADQFVWRGFPIQGISSLKRCLLQLQKFLTKYNLRHIFLKNFKNVSLSTPLSLVSYWSRTSWFFVTLRVDSLEGTSR